MKPSERHVSTGLGYLITKGLLKTVSIETLQTILGVTDEKLQVQSDEQRGLSFDAALVELLSEEVFDGRDQSYVEFLSASRFFTRELKIAPGDNALVVNGRVQLTLPLRKEPSLT